LVELPKLNDDAGACDDVAAPDPPPASPAVAELKAAFDE
jgi:hypothetical protein